MYKVTFQDRELSVELPESGKAMVDNRELEYDLVSTGPNSWNIIANNRSHNVRLLERNDAEKTISLLINNRSYTVGIHDRFDALLEKLGMSLVEDAGLNELKAPMPGLVVEIIAQPGTVVEKGDALLILEAMKMENVIKATGSATVKALHTEKGQTVDKNQLLISFE